MSLIPQRFSNELSLGCLLGCGEATHPFVISRRTRKRRLLQCVEILEESVWKLTYLLTSSFLVGNLGVYRFPPQQKCTELRKLARLSTISAAQGLDAKCGETAADDFRRGHQPRLMAGVGAQMGCLGGFRVCRVRHRSVFFSQGAQGASSIQGREFVSDSVVPALFVIRSVNHQPVLHET